MRELTDLEVASVSGGIGPIGAAAGAGAAFIESRLDGDSWGRTVFETFVGGVTGAAGIGMATRAGRAGVAIASWGIGTLAKKH